MIRHSHFLLLVSVALIAVAMGAGRAWPKDQRLAPEGRGLLPKPAKIPSVAGGAPPLHPFKRHPSGGFARTILVADDSPDFRVIIRDFSFPPDGRPRSISLSSAAFIHRLSGAGAIRACLKRLLHSRWLHDSPLRGQLIW